MYTSYFGFARPPFTIAPDPYFLYATPVYQAAYTTLCAGIHDQKGFLVLTGEAGTGKTTLLHQLIAHLEKDPTVHFVFFHDTVLSFDEILAYTCQRLGLGEDGIGRLKQIQALSKFLMSRSAEGETTALLIDEAHLLDQSVLENIRLLSNIEKENEKLLQIVFAGQPELELKLSHPRLRQLKQRVALTCHLDCLTPGEVGAFVRHRLQMAGANNQNLQNLFSQAALQRIACYSKGIPRLINVICDNALLVAYHTAQQTISPEIIQEVADNLQLQKDIDPLPGQESRIVEEREPPPAEEVRQTWRPGLLERLPLRLAWTAGAAAFFILLWFAAPLSRQAQPEKGQDRSRPVAVAQLPPRAEEEVGLEKAVVSIDSTWEPGPVQDQVVTASESQPVASFAVAVVSESQAEVDHAVLPEGSTPEEEASPPPDTEEVEAQRPLELLARAEQQMVGQRLSMPVGDNALETYQHVLNLVPDQQDAIEGIQKIQEQYRLWAEKAEERQEWAKAQTYYQNALNINPHDETLVSALSHVKEQQLLPTDTVQQGKEERPEERPDERLNARAQLAQLGIPYGQEAFIKSAEEGDTQTVLAFVAAGMSPNVTDEKGWGALMMAAFNGHPTTVQALLERGADGQVSNKTGGTPLMMAAMHGSTDIVHALLDRGAAVDAKDAKGWTAAMYAAWNGHISTVQSLSKGGVDLNTTDRDGWNALMYAVWNGQTAAVRALLNRGAQVGAKNAQGDSALSIATRRGDTTIVELLRQAGARE